MAPEKSRYIRVDDLLPRISLEQVAAYYGVPLPELRRVGNEVRTQCFLNCGKTCETGSRTLAIEIDHPAKQWKCHAYECGKSGNLVSICDLVKPGPHMEGRPRGERFKEIAADLERMAGLAPATVATSAIAPATVTPQAETIAEEVRNVPLAESANERARELVDLDAKFIVDPAEMPPAAAKYFRARPYLTPDVCRRWRMGYLPRDAGGDRRGGTLRGRIVYAYLDPAGQPLCYFGRDPEHAEKLQKWIAGGRQGPEPAKVHFPAGFHRSLELYGMHAFPVEKKRPLPAGVLVVEGPNNVIRLAELGVPSLGLCSNHASDEQAAKLAALAKRVGGDVVTLMLDADVEGDKGAKESLWKLAERGAKVQLAWTRDGDGGRFRDRQPESLTTDEWSALVALRGVRPGD